MNCVKFKNNLIEKPGRATLDEVEKQHIESCPSCRDYFKKMQILHTGLSNLTITPITSNEFSKVQVNIDSRIIGFLGRAFGLYRFMIRYGVGLSAALLVMLISIFPGMYNANNHRVGQAQMNSDIKDAEYAEESEYKEEYINLVIDNFSEQNGFNSGELLIGDLNAEEYEYLLNNIDVEGLL